MEGEDQESTDERSFNSKSIGQRFWIIFAGPFFNFIMAFILSVVYIACTGVDFPVIDKVTEGYAAVEAGLEPGDTIVKLNGYKINFYSEIRVYNFFHAGEDIDVTYERDGVRQTVTLEPKYSEELGSYLIGIQSNGIREKVGPLATVKYAFGEIKYEIYITLKSLGMLFTGQLSVNDMSGPVGVVSTISDVYDQSAASGVFYIFVNMTSIAILLSANLGVMNLLPFPALDGGRIVLLLVEGLRGKKMKAEIENGINLVGFGLLMVLMVVVMYNDIVKLVE